MVEVNFERKAAGNTSVTNVAYLHIQGLFTCSAIGSLPTFREKKPQIISVGFCLATFTAKKLSANARSQRLY